MTNSNQNAPKFLERFRWAYLFFLIVSAVMLRASKIFQTESGMAKPQFGFKGYTPASFDDLTEYFRAEFWSFECFFIADMFLCYLFVGSYMQCIKRLNPEI